MSSELTLHIRGDVISGDKSEISTCLTPAIQVNNTHGTKFKFRRFEPLNNSQFGVLLW